MKMYSCDFEMICGAYSWPGGNNVAFFSNYAIKRHLPYYSICCHYTLVFRQLPCGKLLSYVEHWHASVPAFMAYTI